MNNLLFIFLDGVGLGKEDEFNVITNLFKNLTNKNFTITNFPYTDENLLLKPIDATLKIPGIPQSATGQTSIMTGVSGQGVLGHHHTAFPNKPLIELINRDNILKTLRENGLNVTCANMYSKEFFEKREARNKNMLPVSALSVKAANLPFRYMDDYKKNEAVFADITNEIIRSRGYDIEIITPEVAASNMLNICNKNHFTFFEYFITDSYGHKRLKDKLEIEVDKLNRFIETLWGNGNNNIDIVITSDHGNCEDISTGNHTKNPVPFLFISKNTHLKEYYLENVSKITDFKTGILRYFKKD